MPASLMPKISIRWIMPAVVMAPVLVAAIVLTLVLGSLMWLRREHLDAMLRAVHYVFH